MTPSATPPPLTMRRLLRLYFPLALTFLLMSGSSPIVSKGIGMLPGGPLVENEGLAAFANAFAICLFLYSPCFAVRDAAQKFIRGRVSYRRVLFFHLWVSSACSALLVLVSQTGIADDVILRPVMHIPESLLPAVKRAVLAFVPIPTLIVFRGVHQAVHITNDTPMWIGVGTICRFTAIISFVFGVGVPLGMEGAVMGGLAFAIGIAMEAVVAVVTARRGAALLSPEFDEPRPPAYGELWQFCGPLFVANAMGVFLQPLSMAIVNGALEVKASGAAFQVVKSYTWFFCSTLFAMQTMALAKADSLANLKRLLRFELIPVGAITGLIFVTAFVPPIREWVLRGFFDIDAERTLEFVIATLPIAIVLAPLMALRSTARGLILRSGKTSWVTLSSLAALAALVVANLMKPSADDLNGAATGYLFWIGAMGLEMVVLSYGLAKIGLMRCVTEGGRSNSVE